MQRHLVVGKREYGRLLKMRAHWTEQSERGNTVMLQVLAWIALHLGRWPIHLLLYPIVSYFFLTASDARSASRKYLFKVRGRKPTIIEQFRHLYTFAVVSTDRLFFLSGQDKKFVVQLSGEEIFDQYIRCGHGCILLTSHLGSFEVMRVPGAKDHNLPIRILMDRAHNPAVVTLLDALAPDLAERVLDSGRSAPELVLSMESSLRAGDLLGIMADRARIGEQVQFCDFLGSKAAFPISPWSLSLVMNVPIILCFGLYQGGNRYTVHFELIAEKPSVSRKHRQQVITGYINRYVFHLEHYTRMAPYNWFNFYDFWSNESAADH